MSLFFSNVCFAKQVYSTFPDEIEPSEKYVFYSHGLILEGTNPTPEHPRWGVYDFPEVKQYLSDPSYNLVAYHRPEGTDPQAHARKLADDVLMLIKNGVKPKNITLVGFSRGGVITLFTSHLLSLDDISFVILAGCGDYLNRDRNLKLHGRIYSIIETSDNLVGSCQSIADNSESVQGFSEVSISTGKEHGAFYSPLPDWADLLKNWINQSGERAH